jgi:hypothetical protein
MIMTVILISVMATILFLTLIVHEYRIRQLKYEIDDLYNRVQIRRLLQDNFNDFIIDKVEGRCK